LLLLNVIIIVLVTVYWNDLDSVEITTVKINSVEKHDTYTTYWKALIDITSSTRDMWCRR